ncbi:MAG: hypothetical protein JKY70_01155 [Mucilaginibacter sp.]|nr:hypothetical protein [Mucilaginibacter sp.]
MDKVQPDTDLFILRRIIDAASAAGAIAALVSCGVMPPYLKKTDAYKRFGRYRVEQWITKGLVTARKDGNQSAAWRIDRVELETLHLAEALAPFL